MAPVRNPFEFVLAGASTILAEVRRGDSLTVLGADNMTFSADFVGYARNALERP